MVLGALAEVGRDLPAKLHTRNFSAAAGDDLVCTGATARPIGNSFYVTEQSFFSDLGVPARDMNKGLLDGRRGPCDGFFGFRNRTQ